MALDWPGMFVIYAFVALTILAFVGAATAVTFDKTRTHPARTYNMQMVHYYRATINFNDPVIGTGVWYGSLPPNAYVLSMDAYVTTAFNAGTNNFVTVGATATTGNEFIGNTDITSGTIGVYHLTTSNGLGLKITSNTTYQTSINGEVPLYAKYVQSGTAATAGQATIIIAYIPNNDQ